VFRKRVHISCRCVFRGKRVRQEDNERGEGVLAKQGAGKIYFLRLEKKDGPFQKASSKIIKDKLEEEVKQGGTFWRGGEEPSQAL